MLDLLLELRDRHIELAGDKCCVAVCADELPLGIEEFAKLPLVQEMSYIVVGGGNAELVSLSQQNLLLH